MTATQRALALDFGRLKKGQLKISYRCGSADVYRWCSGTISPALSESGDDNRERSKPALPFGKHLVSERQSVKD
jgi:hypothetical protein